MTRDHDAQRPHEGLATQRRRAGFGAEDAARGVDLAEDEGHAGAEGGDGGVDAGAEVGRVEVGEKGGGDGRG